MAEPTMSKHARLPATPDHAICSVPTSMSAFGGVGMLNGHCYLCEQGVWMTLRGVLRVHSGDYVALCMDCYRDSYFPRKGGGGSE